MEQDMDPIQGTPTPTFRHQHLDTTTEQIRLFRVLPRESASDPIRGTLQKVRYSEVPFLHSFVVYMGTRASKAIHLYR